MKNNTSWRRLTPGEIEMAQLVFSNGIDYGKVKIYRGIRFVPNIRTAVSPNGHIYFPRNCPEDFSRESLEYRMWLIHELTHVWQYQQGFKTWLAGIAAFVTGQYRKRRIYRYPYPVPAFHRLNFEQQADVAAHYYAAAFFPESRYGSRQASLQTAIRPLLANPHRKRLLPRIRIFQKNTHTAA